MLINGTLMHKYTVVTIGWTELDYAAPEVTMVMNGNIGTDIQISNPITVLVTPLTYEQAQARGFQLPSGTLPFASEGKYRVNNFETN